MVHLDENDNPVSERVIGWQDWRYIEMLPELKAEIALDEYWQISGMPYGTYNIPVLRKLCDSPL